MPGNRACAPEKVSPFEFSPLRIFPAHQVARNLCDFIFSSVCECVHCYERDGYDVVRTFSARFGQIRKQVGIAGFPNQSKTWTSYLPQPKQDRQAR